jgi:tubulin monoglycylase TTLL3/8
MTENQICNHFEKSTNLTTKVGLCKNLKNLIWFNNVDIDSFYPKCFDVSEQSDYEEFIIYFKLIKAESVLKQFLSGAKIPETRVEVAYKVCVRRLKELDDIIDDPHTQWDMLNDKEWESLNEDSMSIEELKKIKHENWISKLDKEFNQKPKKKKKKKDDKKNKEGNFEEIVETELVRKCREVLIALQEKFPQFDINGKANIWIVKPAGLSRGRGIRCHCNLVEIQDHIQKEGTWVVQKYIENPLCVLKKKFDIRQWVLVTCWNPLTVWFYERSYLRFGVEDFSIDNLKNRFIHLTNNSVQKNSEHFESTEIEGSMWHSEEFAEYLNEETGSDIYEESIKPKIKKIVLYTLECVQDMVENTKSAAELYGYDIMIDQDYNPWLIEINSSPAMDYSTPVTKELVKQVLEDTVKVMVDYHYAKGKKKKRVNTGNFSLLHKAKTVVDRPLQAVGLNLLCEGKSINK